MNYEVYTNDAGKEHYEDLLREAKQERRANEYLNQHPEEKTSNKVRNMLVKLLSSTVR